MGARERDFETVLAFLDNLGGIDDPDALKRFIADSARRPRVTPLEFLHREKVAIIGAGPAGLTAAWDLRRRR